MAKRIKTVRAGRLVFGVCYTQALPGDSARARAAKNKCSSAARRALNFRAAWQKLRLLLAANFARGDLWITLTYDDEHLPDNRREAKKRMALFLDRLRAARKRDGEELRYVYNTEELLDGGGRRLHHHMVISAGAAQKDYELIRSLWSYGSNIEIRRLGEHQMFADDFLELAKYMCKERDPDAKVYNVGDKCWVSSRNLARPVVESEIVGDNVTITAPPGAVVIDEDHTRNEYGSFDYLVYMLPPGAPAAQPKPKPKTRRRRKIAEGF